MNKLKTFGRFPPNGNANFLKGVKTEMKGPAHRPLKMYW
jgi:hypothetical protein